MAKENENERRLTSVGAEIRNRNLLLVAKDPVKKDAVVGAKIILDQNSTAGLAIRLPLNDETSYVAATVGTSGFISLISVSGLSKVTLLAEKPIENSGYGVVQTLDIIDDGIKIEVILNGRSRITVDVASKDNKETRMGVFVRDGNAAYFNVKK